MGTPLGHSGAGEGDGDTCAGGFSCQGGPPHVGTVQQVTLRGGGQEGADPHPGGAAESRAGDGGVTQRVHPGGEEGGLSPTPTRPDGERCWDLPPSHHHHHPNSVTPWPPPPRLRARSSGSRSSSRGENHPRAPGGTRRGGGVPHSPGSAQLSRSLLVWKLHIVLRRIFCFFTCEIFLSEPVNVQISSGGLSYVF